MRSATPPGKLCFMRLCYKNAQASGTSAAALVAVIALLIIFYLLFIPPSFRDQILEGNSSSSSSSSSSLVANETLLRASPGTLSKISSEEFEHNIPAVILYAKIESKVLGSLSALSVKSSLFGSKFASMQFSVDDPEVIDNVLLSFVDKYRKGALTIKLNGNEVFSGDISSENPTPVRLDKKFVLRGVNRLDFEVEKVGFRFWRVNKHSLENLQLTADLSDLSKQKSSNIFVVSATEKANVKRAFIKFVPDCVSGRTGRLNVLINMHSIYYSVPDCGGRVVIEFDPNILREGENSIVFDSEEGNYLIDLISINSELKEVLQPAYYFEVTPAVLSEIRDGKYTIFLKITFTEGNEQKSGSLNINGRETSIFQSERTFSKNINDYIIEGNNAIKIVPETTLELVSLEVVKG